MTYSKDFRQHVLDYKEEHELTFEQTSQHFDISCRSLFRWADKVEPCTKRNKPATKVDMEQLRCDVESHPDDYQCFRASEHACFFTKQSEGWVPGSQAVQRPRDVTPPPPP